MKLKMYCLFDSAASAFVQPFFMPNDGLALRAFSANINSKQETDITLHPEQFTLFRVGEFDDQTGKFEALATPMSLGIGVEFVENIVVDDSNVAMFIDRIDSLEKMIKNLSKDIVSLPECLKDQAL